MGPPMQSPAQLLLLAGLVAAPGLLKATTYRSSVAIGRAALETPPEPDDEEVVEVSILRLKNLRYRQGRPLPAWVQKLDGKRVSIWGYMAVGTLEGLPKFELVPESCECGRSKLNHFVDVTLTDDQTRFIPGRITLEGTFYASELEEDGFVTSLFRLTTDALP